VNKHLVDEAPGGIEVIKVMLNDRQEIRLGRGRDADIHIEQPTISRHHCVFVFSTQHSILTVMLQDRSFACRTYTLGSDKVDFAPGMTRQVLVNPSLNTEIGLAGTPDAPCIRFRLRWVPPFMVKTLDDAHLSDPRDAGTLDDEIPAVTDSTTLAPGRVQRMSYGECLGSGTFGRVFQATTVHTGKIFAVKVIPVNHCGMREVKAISKLSHVRYTPVTHRLHTLHEIWAG
jgi:hypothetical protein